MNETTRWLRFLILALVVLEPAMASDTPAAAPAAASQASSTAPSAKGSPSPGPAATQGDSTAKPDARKAPVAGAKPTPQRFEPTEKVRPDFDVSFPVDI